jgi:hypothetical protein
MRELVLRGGVRPPTTVALLDRLGGFRPPNDGNFVLLVALGVLDLIKKILFLSFLFLYFCIFVFFI